MPEKARELLNEALDGRPVWVRPPKGGLERFSGLGRSKLYQLAAERRIRSVSLRSPGQVKGCRLFNLASILEYIERCEIESLAAGAEVAE